MKLFSNHSTKTILTTGVILLAPVCHCLAGLTMTISEDGDGNAVAMLEGSGNTVSTTFGTWDSAGGELWLGNSADNAFASSLGGANASASYTSNGGRFAGGGFSVTAGSQTLVLDRFVFEDDGNSADDMSWAFGNGVSGTAWDTTGSGVGTIVVNTTGWLNLTDAGGNNFAFAGNFNDGEVMVDAGDDAHVFWGGSGSVRLEVDRAAYAASVPEPSSAFLVTIALMALVKRRVRA